MGGYDRNDTAGTMSTIVRQTILLTGALSVLPLLPYPNTFGMGMLGAAPWLGAVETLLYLGILSIIARWLTAPQLVAGAVLSFAYRVGVGSASGTLMSISNNMPWTAAMGLTLWSYPIAVFPHFIAAPLVMRSILRAIWSEVPQRSRRRPVPSAFPASSRRAESSVRPDTAPRIVQNAAAARSFSHHLPGLDDAVTYVGEYDGVRMCWLVDHEGLPLAIWQKQEYTGNVDFWAPISVEIVDFNRRCLSVGGDVKPLRVEVRTDAGRIILETAGDYWLGVLTDRETDELIGLRLSQSREMILKHLQERCAQYAGLQEARYV